MKQENWTKIFIITTILAIYGGYLDVKKLCDVWEGV